MNNKTALASDIRSALNAAHHVKPRLFQVADLIGITRLTIADCIGLAQQTISNLSTGRYPITDRHARQLRSLLRKAHAVGLQVVRAQLDKPSSPIIGLAAEVYAQRLQHAGELLDLDDFDG